MSSKYLKFSTCLRIAFLTCTSLAVLLQGATSLSAQEGEITPPQASVGAVVPNTYFGPAPSLIQKELTGPYQLLKSGEVNLKDETITLPLYQGQLRDGRKVWYILTDVTDPGTADALGLNYSAKLNSVVGRAVRLGTLEKNTTVTFESGAVDFRPNRRVVPGEAPNFFPPKTAEPGSVGDQNYSPLVRIQNAGNFIWNAPIVAFNVEASQISFCDGNPDYSLVHDKVVKICPQDQTVTLKLTQGFSFARPVLYVSMDTNDPLAATLEGATYAPGLRDVTVGHDDSAFSAVERLFIFANGPTGKGNPQRQGLNSAIADGLSPLNVFGGIPTVATDYSPLWDLNLGVWTKEAIDKAYRSRLTEEFEILKFAQDGWITGPNGGKWGSTGLIVNCPIVWRFR
ncbi:MAG: hypothetical protein WAM04_11145 [Candidatus Sulfotelmatobacter sp.]